MTVPNAETRNSIDVSLLIKSGGKYSDPHKFTYINVERGKGFITTTLVDYISVELYFQTELQIL